MVTKLISKIVKLVKILHTAFFLDQNFLACIFILLQSACIFILLQSACIFILLQSDARVLISSKYFRTNTELKLHEVKLLCELIPHSSSTMPN